MSKQDLQKPQSYILKVNIDCDGCEHKVKKLLQKIDGVYTVNIDAAQGKVAVTGIVDPGTLIKKLKSSGKHAELWGQKGMMFPTNQFKNFQIDHHGKGGKDNKSHKGGKEQQKGGGQAQMFQFQNKGAKDLTLPAKGHKSVKFNLPEDEFDASDDGFDDDELYDDDFDDYDDDEEDEEEHVHGHPMPNKMMNGHKGNSGGGKNAKKVDVMDLKSKGGKNESKNGGNGGKKNHEGGGEKHKSGGGGGNKKNKKSSGGLLGRFLGFGQKGDDKNKNKKKGGGGGGGGGNNKGKDGKKGGGKFEAEGYDIDDDDDDDFDEFHTPHHGKGKQGKGGQGGKGGKKGHGNGHGNVGQMGPNLMGMDQMRNLMQGLPAMNGGGGGYYHGMQMQQPPPPQFNPQQHYMATMMNHGLQQQPYLNNMYPPPMMYGRPYMPPPPPIPVHPGADPVTHAFSDENTESCTIM